MAEESEKDFKEEIEDLLVGLDSKAEPESEPEPELKPEVEPKAELESDLELESESEKKDVDPEPELEEKESEPEIKSEAKPEVEEEKDELTLLKEQNEKLLARLEAEPAVLKAPEPGAEPEVKPETKDSIEKIEFIPEDEDIGALLEDHAKLNDLLNRVYSMGIEKSSTMSRESTIRSIPQIVTQQVQQQTFLRKTIGEFFEGNPQLAIAKRTVGAITNEVVAENPDWSLDKVLEEAGERSYKVLGIVKKAVEKGGDVKPKRNPSLPGGSKGERPKTKKSGSVQDEIDELIDL